MHNMIYMYILATPTSAHKSDLPPPVICNYNYRLSTALNGRY